MLYVPRAVTLYVGGSKNSRNFWVPPRIVMCRVALTVTELFPNVPLFVTETEFTVKQAMNKYSAA